tara:strand:- start:57 stop:374 length:318 start_codon:yes stop_codon:yes gene_type:complete
MEKITWLEGLETEDMMNIVKSKFPKKNIWMEFGTVWADDLSETEALDLSVMLTGLTACEVKQSCLQGTTTEPWDQYAFDIGHKLKRLSETGYGIWSEFAEEGLGA